jgi:hypothetical protein
VSKAHFNFFQRPFFSPSIDLQSHRGARSKRRQQKRIGIRPGVAAARLARLIGDQRVSAGSDLLLQVTNRGDDDLRHEGIPFYFLFSIFYFLLKRIRQSQY